jgi:hypothetical protein
MGPSTVELDWGSESPVKLHTPLVSEGGLEVCLLMACWAALSDMFERSAWPVIGRLLVDDCGDNCLARDHSPLTKFPSRLVMDRFMESSYP